MGTNVIDYATLAVSSAAVGLADGTPAYAQEKVSGVGLKPAAL